MVSYRVTNGVQTHDAYGVGAYSINIVNNFWWNSGFSAPSASKVRFHGAFTWSIINGGIKNVINNVGDNSGQGTTNMRTVCEFSNGQI